MTTESKDLAPAPLRTRKPSIMQDSVPHMRRMSVMQQDTVPSMAGPSMRRASRRESRIEPRGIMPMFGGRRMSMMSKTSLSGTSDQKLHAFHVKLQNTYRLAPNAEDVFKPSIVEKAARKVLDRYLIGETYETEKCKLMAQNISEDVRARCKELVCPRYKVICYVAVGQDCGQSVSLTSRSLWNTETDNSCTVKQVSGNIFAVVTIFAVYLD